jgi:hypothetical protein
VTGDRRRALVAGWFSFPDANATAGDLLAKDVVCGWLDAAGLSYDVAIDPRFGAGVAWDDADPGRYSHVVFVCGPFYRSDLLRRFERSRLVGIDVSMVHPVEEWNPFDLLLERDSTVAARPDLALAAPRRRVPVVGVTLLPLAEAKAAPDGYARASEAVDRLLARREVAPFPIDTGLRDGPTDLRTPAAVDAAFARVDVVVTTRLHGLVLGLRHGVPVLAIDPVPGGERVRRQAEVLGWEPVLGPDDLDDATLDRAFDECLSPEATARARACAERAVRAIGSIERALADALATPPGDDGSWGDGRRRRTWLAPEDGAAPGGPDGLGAAARMLRGSGRRRRRRRRQR